MRKWWKELAMTMVCICVTGLTGCGLLPLVQTAERAPGSVSGETVPVVAGESVSVDEAGSVLGQKSISMGEAVFPVNAASQNTALMNAASPNALSQNTASAEFSSKAQMLQFTNAQKKYIKRHPVIYVAGNASLAPLERFNKVEYVGVLPVIFQRISELSGLSFVYMNGSYDSEQYAKNHQVEIISGINEEEARQLGLKDFTEMFIDPGVPDHRIGIGYTDIAAKELEEIITKCYLHFDRYDMQEILMEGVTEGNENVIDTLGFQLVVVLAAVLAVALMLTWIISAKKQYRLRYTDELTGKYNYAWLKKEFDKRFSSGEKYAYFVANFKIDVEEIERLYGYSQVSVVLDDVLTVLKESQDSMEGSARLFDDTIIYVGSAASESLVESRIRTVIDTFRRYQIERQRQYDFRISVGLYFLKGIDDTLDRAVYYALQARTSDTAIRQGIAVCTDEMIRNFGEDIQMEKAVLAALDKKEFISYVQPIVNIADHEEDFGQILARWDSKKYGLVRPDLFLRILGRHNLMDDLDFLMFENACDILFRLAKERRKLATIFCSFSRSAVEKANFFERLEETIAEYNVSPRCLGIIINKDNMDLGLDHLKASIRKIKESGMTVLLDDFDQSPYALRNVDQLDIDYIKISRDLLMNLSNPNSQRILEGIINTMHGVGVKVICKDFTDEENLPILQEISCDGVQGNKYYYPMPVDEFVKLVPEREESVNNREYGNSKSAYVNESTADSAGESDSGSAADFVADPSSGKKLFYYGRDEQGRDHLGAEKLTGADMPQEEIVFPEEDQGNETTEEDWTEEERTEEDRKEKERTVENRIEEERTVEEAIYRERISKPEKEKEKSKDKKKKDKKKKDKKKNKKKEISEE